MINSLISLSQSGQPVVSSRDISEHFGKEHRNVLRDIDDLRKDVLNFEQMFFAAEIPDSYGRPQRAYLMNRDGFTLIAMGFTGKEALEWKIKYIDAFNKMEAELKAKPLTPAEQLLAQASLLVEQEKRLAAVEQKQRQMDSAVKSAFETLAAPAADRDQWQEEMNRKIRQMCLENGLNYQTTIGEMYRELEETAGVNLKTRQKRLRERMKRGGAKYAECAGVSKLLVVSQDKKLREIYSGIVRARAAGLIAARSF